MSKTSITVKEVDFGNPIFYDKLREVYSSTQNACDDPTIRCWNNMSAYCNRNSTQEEMNMYRNFFNAQQYFLASVVIQRDVENYIIEVPQEDAESIKFIDNLQTFGQSFGKVRQHFGYTTDQQLSLQSEDLIEQEIYQIEALYENYMEKIRDRLPQKPMKFIGNIITLSLHTVVHTQACSSCFYRDDQFDRNLQYDKKGVEDDNTFSSIMMDPLYSFTFLIENQKLNFNNNENPFGKGQGYRAPVFNPNLSFSSNTSSFDSPQISKKSAVSQNSGQSLIQQPPRPKVWRIMK